MTDNNYTYLPKSEQQLRSWFLTRQRQGKIGAMDWAAFLSWYTQEKKRCHYCGLTEQQSQALVQTGKLTSKRFPQNGKPGPGTSRGMWLEVDRCNPAGQYEPGNIVLCCYFCNNDKSDVFHGEQYRQFFEDRRGFLVGLLS